MKVTWKYIPNGAGWSGPYAYLQDTVRKGKKVSSVHVAYLGAGVSAGQSIQHKTPKGTTVQAVVPKPPPPPALPTATLAKPVPGSILKKFKALEKKMQEEGFWGRFPTIT